MSLNMKLQSSAAKNQARNIELEIRKIEARESKELLAIVQVRRVSETYNISLQLLPFSPTCPKFTWRRIAMLPIATCSSNA